MYKRQVETFVAEIEKYNKFCEYGIDEDFGRYAEVLFPVKDGPFYALCLLYTSRCV